MDVKYEIENIISNHNLETKYNSFTVEYSKDNRSQLLTEISNVTSYLGMNWLNLEDNFWIVFDQRYLRHNLGWTITLVVAYTLIFFVGFVGNCMVILVFVKRLQMRTVTNMFIINLAVADLLVIIFCVPGELLINIFKPWILGSVGCKGVSYMEWVSVCASAYSLAAISLDRCKAIYRPQMPPRGLSKRQASFTICLIWTIAMTLTVPYTMILKVIMRDQISYCIPMWENELYEKVYLLVVPRFIFFCLPLILIFISNMVIWCNVSKRKVPEESASTSRIDRMHRESRQSVGKMLGIVTLAFLLSWLPLYVLSTKANYIKKLSRWEFDILLPLAQLLGISNSSINPVLYVFLNKKFREMFKSLLPKWAPFVNRTEHNCKKLCASTATITNGAFNLNFT